jgi:spore germination protein GerM
LAVGSDRPEALLTAAFERLLWGPQQPDRFSEIPPGTRLLNLTATPDGAIAVDLSDEFTQGGGSASMIGRLGQVVYTATTLNPEAPVRISVNGEPLNVLGGEGLEVPQPVTRQQFEREFLQISFNREPPRFKLGKSVKIRIET